MEHAKNRRFSRWMPPLPDSTISPWALRVGCAAGAVLAVAAMYFSIEVRLAVAFCGVAIAVDAVRRGRRMRRLAAARAGESICTFARSLDPRTVDTWVIRAVYEELQPYAVTGSLAVPLRATDRLYGELGIDDEELDSVARDIARRTGRLLDPAERNPFRPVATVGDLVRFFAHQPRASGALRGSG